ncbi:SPFH domain-containing protein [Lentzea rhizosphaerae]|uniref:SPFH domain-containing protein n=1 Tax=Lentzea rhizosphaerae TaxID=2041025 RepID=A0ABV8BUJ6_9PSEU
MEFLIVVVVIAAVAGVVWVKSHQSVPTGKIGLVYKRFGSLKNEKYPVRVHGGQGVQVTTLQADRRYRLPPLLYRVEAVDRTHVPTGTIGLVIAKVGAVPSVEETLCRHVECDYFQDGRKFLLRGGQMGKQPMVLPGGASYDINPALFEVITVDTLGDEEKYEVTRSDLTDISIPEGATGVVIAKHGESPDEDENTNTVGPVVEGHSSFQKPWEFLANGGRRGAQAETLSHGGVYRINPWFARIAIIPTRELTLEWERKEGEYTDRFDAALGQIVVNVEGERIKFTMSQIIRIPAKAAPRLVRRFGEDTDMTGLGDVQSPTPVQRFVARVLGRTVEGYFHSCASEYEVLRFLESHNEVRMELESRVAEALGEWGVQAGRTTLSDFEPENPELDQRRRRKAEERDRQEELGYQRRNAELEEEIRRIRLATDEIEVALPVAEIKARAEVLGPEFVGMKEVMGELAKMQSPNTYIGDVGAAGSIVPTVIGQEMLRDTLKSLNPEQPPQLDRRKNGQIESGDRPDEEE